MARVLFLNGPLISHVNPSLGISKALVERGEEVTYALTPEFQEAIEATGARFIPFDPGTYGMLMKWDLRRDLITSDAEWELLQSKAEQKVLDCLTKIIKPGDFDYIVHDEVYGAGVELAKILKIPRICLCARFVKITEENSSSIKKFNEALKDFLSEPLVCLRTLWTRGNISTRYGIPIIPLRDIYANRADLSIVLTTKLLQPNPEKLDSSFVFTGPTFDYKTYSDDTFSLPDTEEKIIYVALGTIFPNMEFYHTCIEALKDVDAKVVVSVGNKLDITEFGELPPNFIIRNFVPQLKVLEKTALFVSHAGANSLNESLYHDVPLVLVPHAEDQFMNADIACDAGFALSVHRKELTVENLRQMVHRVMNEESFSVNARRFGNSLRNMGGSKRAAEEILRFVKGIQSPLGESNGHAKYRYQEPPLESRE